MFGRSATIRILRPLLHDLPLVKSALKRADTRLGRLRHDLAKRFPALIRPDPTQMTIAITAQCNLLCRGCRYGRDFMLGEKLSLDLVRDALDDARAAGVNRVRFFGGEPLLHPDLGAMIRHAKSCGMEPYITTNGTLLDRRIDELHDAGLRWLSIGFYGVDGDYDEYTQRKGHFAKLRRSLQTVRASYGSEVGIQINYVLTRRAANLAAWEAAWAFAQEFDLSITIDPVSDTVPFFWNPEGNLHFVDGEHDDIVQAVVDRILECQAQRPDRMTQSATLLRALPDILLRRETVKVPCNAYRTIWIGANGTVQLCDTYFELGNLHEKRLREILFGPEHRKACRDGFALKCPDCCCGIDGRMQRDSASIKRWGTARAPRS